MKLSLFDKSSIDYMIVGLGNPGDKYATTRHNAGFMAIDALAASLGVSINKLKFNGLYATCKIGGKKLVLVKPLTFMNNSGQCVSLFSKFYKLPPQRMIVLVDDISLDVGKMRIRREGTHGGHNGLRDIQALMGSTQYPRIKIGVGKKPHPEMDLADWVLGKFSKSELDTLKDVNDHCIHAMELMIEDQIDKAMNLFNS